MTEHESGSGSGSPTTPALIAELRAMANECFPPCLTVDYILSLQGHIRDVADRLERAAADALRSLQTEADKRFQQVCEVAANNLYRAERAEAEVARLTPPPPPAQIVKKLRQLAVSNKILCENCLMQGGEHDATARYYVQGAWHRIGRAVCRDCWNRAMEDGIKIVASEPIVQPPIVAELLDLASAAEGALGPLPPWQPIETAPKDGTRIDIWAKAWLPAFDRFESQRFPNCWWWKGDSMGGASAKWMELSSDWHPTHWMPVPAGPLPSPQETPK